MTWTSLLTDGRLSLNEMRVESSCELSALLSFSNNHLSKEISMSPEYMSRVMRKPAFYTCENKDADQLRGNSETDQRLCFRYIEYNSSTFSIRNYKPLAIFCCCTAWFVSDQVGNQNIGFLMTRLIYGHLTQVCLQDFVLYCYKTHNTVLIAAT